MKRSYPFAWPSDLYFTVTSWAVMRRAGIVQAELKSAGGGAPAYMYLVDWESAAAAGQFKAFHGVDIPMAFDNVPLAGQMLGTAADQAQRVADAMSAAWVAFARSGNPGWPVYDTKTRQTMVFNVSSKLVADPDGDERQLLWGPPYNPFLDYAARPDRPR
jgi:para-nitrobenzyl esterase